MLLRMSLGEIELLEAASLDAALHDDMGAPDVVLLDIYLKGLSGLAGIELITRQWPQARIIMVSSDTAGNTSALALARGALAFVSKEEPPEKIVAVVQQALDGAMPMPATAAVAASGHFIPKGHSVSPAPPLDTARLTPRQSEVLDLLCQGLPNKAIGRRLNLSENTVRWHVQAILALLGVSNRSEAAFAARNRGLVR